MRGSLGTQTYLKQNTVVSMSNRCILELNMNRYATIGTISDSVYGTSNVTYWKNKFPLASVVRPVRPTSGIVRPRFGAYSSTVKWQSRNWLNNFNLSATYDGTNDWYTMLPRYYVAGPNDPYKYFTGSAKMPTAQIDYVSAVWANKVVIGFENTFDYPTTYTIQANISSVWTTIATSPTIPADGVVNVYRVAGSWTTTAPTSPALADAIQITGLRVVPTVMNRANGYLALIEISPRVQADVSAYLQDWSTEESFSEDDALTPVGTISANSGSVTFSNTDNIFEVRLAGGGSIRLGDIAKKYARVTVDTIINSESIRMIDMFCDTWNIKEGDTADVPLLDPAIILQNADSPEVIYGTTTPSTAIIKLLDAFGWNKVRVRKLTTEVEPKIDWFYTTKDVTVWDAIKSVCRSHQYAVWFDEAGYLNIGTKNWLFSRSTPQWTFLGQVSGGDKPNIVEHSEHTEQPINKGVAKFYPTGTSKSNDPTNRAFLDKSVISYNKPATRILYSPEKGILLGCALLTGTLTSGATSLYIGTDSLTNNLNSLILWGNFSGYCYIDQEIIKFDGLEFSYMNSGGSPVTKVVKTADELSEVYAEAIGKVSFTGGVMNLSRGQFGTTGANHGFSKSSLSIPAAVDKYVSIQPTVGRVSRSLVINNLGALGTNATAYFNPGGAYNSYRVRLSIADTKYPRANVFVSATKDGSNNITSGYRISFQASKDGGIKEVGIYRVGGSPGVTEAAYDATILPGKYYDFTISTQFNVRNLDIITVSGPGFTAVARYPAGKIAYTQGVALGAYGGATVAFDYFGAGVGGATSTDILQSQALENILKDKSGLISNTTGYFQEFTDLVREIYVEDVRFSKGPATTVAWYPAANYVVDNKIIEGNVGRREEVAGALSNIGPWGCRVAVANIGHRPILLDNSDQNAYPLIYGNIVEELQEIEVTNKNDASIIKFGENKLEVDSQWLTTRKAAQDQIDWLVTTMATGREIHDISSFDNPLIEVGDIVTMDYTKKGISTAVNYVIQKVSRSWSAGLDTNVTMVRV
jgi:hypothetical protein